MDVANNDVPINVFFDEINTNCCIVNSVSIYLTWIFVWPTCYCLYFDGRVGGGVVTLTRPICSAPPPQLFLALLQAWFTGNDTLSDCLILLQIISVCIVCIVQGGLESLPL